MTVERLGRAVGLYRQTAASRSAVALLVANAIPIIGVLFFGWSLITILVLFWVENGIVGFWNVPKIALAGGTGTKVAATGSLGMLPNLGLAIFFVAHYGIFWVVHGVFVFALPAFGSFGVGSACLDGFPPGIDAPFPGPPQCEAGAFGDVLWGPIALAAVVLFLSHGASFLFNYLGRAEYVRATPGGQMMAPYARVIVLHITILVGAFVIALLGAPIGALLVLVLLKTAFDLGLHLREHRGSGHRSAVVQGDLE